ncbi:MAG: transposase [Bacilli bacterium]|nr:transposase [Bacilli bacterium]
MISYKYKLYHNKNNKYLEAMLREACFVWNHALALQKRYYALYKAFIPSAKMQKHFAKHIKRNLLHSQSVQEILQRLDVAYNRFFKHISKRPPKFKKSKDFCSFAFKQGGFALNGNELTINRLKKRFRFSYSRSYEGRIKMLRVKRSHLGEFYVLIITDSQPKSYVKSHNGASIGIDFGLKTYMTLSNGKQIEHPQFLKRNLKKIRKASRRLSKCEKGSNHKELARKAYCRLQEALVNKREDFMWKLSHDLCRKYDYIFIEDLNLQGMVRMWGRKVTDLSHGTFVSILEQVSRKYGVTIHKIDRWYASSKLCKCGYKNENLALTDRQWVCPHCGQIHDRDVNAAKNILRRGISELVSSGKTNELVDNKGQLRLNQESHVL